MLKTTRIFLPQFKNSINVSRARLEEYTQTLITDANVANAIEFVEILYKNDSGNAQLLFQIENGVIRILN